MYVLKVTHMHTYHTNIHSLTHLRHRWPLGCFELKAALDHVAKLLPCLRNSLPAGLQGSVPDLRLSSQRQRMLQGQQVLVETPLVNKQLLLPQCK